MEQYFKSYEELDVHQLMLTDKPRTLAYKNAIFNSRDKFEGKVVMDVGAGTGILSIFCAQAGAVKVFSIEASDMANIAEEVVKENNLSEKIKVFHRKIEDIKSEEIPKVDVIVSEWMGFYLVHEGMLDSVLYARDHFLHEDGILFPCIAKLYASPCQLPLMFDFWDDVYGVSMKCVGREFRKEKSVKAEVMIVNPEDILTEGKLLAWLDLQFTTPEEIKVLGGDNYVTVCKKDGKYQGICIWFAVEFPDGSELSTSPYDQPTHWKQTAVVLPTCTDVVQHEPIAFKLELSKDSLKPRQYNIELSSLDASETEHDIPCNCHMTKCIVTRSYIESQEKESTLNE